MVEKASYEVVGNVVQVEIRKYPTLTLATVYEHTENEAFELLFRYIIGKVYNWQGIA